MSTPAAAGTVTLEWDPVKSPLLAGYAIHYGPASGTYTTKLDVGNTTRYQVSNLVEGNTYYFVVTPYDAAYAESEPSNEVSTTVRSVASVAGSDFRTTVWLDDAAPAGAMLAGDGGDGWNWVANNPPPFSGLRSHQSALAAGEHGHYFWGVTQTMPVAAGDTLIAHVYLDPAYPPRELMLQWFDGTWHRAYWGADLIPWGVDGTQSRYRMGPLPPAGQWVTLSVPASLVGLEGSTVTGMGFTLYDGRASWDFAGKTTSPSTTVWLDDAAPAGAMLAGDGGDGWNWVATNPAPFSGLWAHQSALAAGEHGHYFWGATQTLSVAAGDTLVARVYLDPAYPPRELMLQWFDGTWHRAYWGVDLIPWGVDGTQSRYPMGPLPPAGRWVTLSVPASLVGLEGSTVTGMGFTLYDGRATWD